MLPLFQAAPRFVRAYRGVARSRDEEAKQLNANTCKRTPKKH